MPSFNFADSYRLAGIDPEPGIIERREEAFSSLRDELSAEEAIDLTRIYFGLPDPSGEDFKWFREGVATTDASFTLLDNQREAAVLASCLLAAGLEDGIIVAGLAPVVAYAQGNRRPVYRDDSIEWFDQRISEIAVTDRERAELGTLQVDKLSAPKTQSRNDNTVIDWNGVEEIAAKSSELLRRQVNVAVSQLLSMVQPMVKQLGLLQEEVDLLWWHIAGWSRVLKCPYYELDGAVASAMVGFDAACLTSSSTGGVAIPALLHRTIHAGTRGKTGKLALPGKVTIQGAVDAYPEESLKELACFPRLSSVEDLCPVLTAYSKANGIGASPAWHNSFERVTEMSVSAEFSPIDLAMQVYRETLLLKNLGQD